MGESTLRAEVLAKYKTSTFIETGTAAGEGIAVALEVGFENIISIEANPRVFKAACDRYADKDNVQLIFGDSGAVLPDVLRGIQRQATFWLDAHWSTGEEDLGPSVNKCPILQDLRAIGGHQIKDHIILIDDIRYFKAGGLPQWNGVQLGDIMEMILEVNPGYCIGFEDGFVRDDILVATVKERQ